MELCGTSIDYRQRLFGACLWAVCWRSKSAAIPSGGPKWSSRAASTCLGAPAAVSLSAKAAKLDAAHDAPARLKRRGQWSSGRGRPLPRCRRCRLPLDAVGLPRPFFRLPAARPIAPGPACLRSDRRGAAEDWNRSRGPNVLLGAKKENLESRPDPPVRQGGEMPLNGTRALLQGSKLPLSSARPCLSPPKPPASSSGTPLTL